MFDYVLTALDTSGDTTWSSIATVSGWTTTNLADVYETSGGNVGIGTTITNAGAALSVMNGNVGIGTWVPNGALIVQGGNVGIGSVSPGNLLDVNGNVQIVGIARFNDGSGHIGQLSEVFGGGYNALLTTPDPTNYPDSDLTVQPHISLGDGVSFASVNSNSTANESMGIQSDKILFLPGNVGVGLIILQHY